MISIRPITPADDLAMAAIIRGVMTEFGAVGAGYSINDPEVDAMASAYAAPGCAFFVAVLDQRVVGGAGIAPLLGGDGATCELRKMYFLREARGHGAGAAMMQRCLDSARQLGFKRCYLETLGSMHEAMRLYERSGFKASCAPLGATGHSSCDRWYTLDLT